MKKRSFSLNKSFRALAAHKMLAGVVVVTCAVGAYGIYRSALVADAAPQYVLSPARLGTLTQSVSGTGQVSASNQTNIQSQVSGTIDTIDVSVGQNVSQGQLIATIDDTDALNSLQSAQIALGKLTEAPKQTDIDDAQNTITQSYSTTFNAISSLYLDLQTIMPEMNSLFNGQGSYLSDQSETQLTPPAQTYRDDASQSYDKVNVQYQALLPEYTALSQTSSTTTIATDLNDAYALGTNVASTLSQIQNAVTYISTNQPTYMAKNVATAQSNATAWSNSINNDVASLLSAQNGIANAENALTTLVSPPDTYDLQSVQLALQQAQQTYDNYFIRAPYDGIIGSIPVNVFGQASGGATIATIFGVQKIATISLDEVDAANVQVGQPVSITFDAINGFTATGTVEEIDQVGTVVSGVVSYPVKISINTQDDRIKPGMSVNVVITTKTESNVVLVPSSAIKTQGTRSYVQVLASSTMSSLLGGRAGTGRLGSSTRQFGNGASSSTLPFTASSTAFASSTGGFRSGTGAGAGGTPSSATAPTLTVSSAVAPQNVFVTTGDSDSSNTVILSGLNPGALVVTRTIAASAATATAAPSLLTSLGAGGRAGAAGGLGGGGGGAVRFGGGEGGAVRIGG